MKEVGILIVVEDGRLGKWRRKVFDREVEICETGDRGVGVNDARGDSDDVVLLVLQPLSVLKGNTAAARGAVDNFPSLMGMFCHVVGGVVLSDEIDDGHELILLDMDILAQNVCFVHNFD